MLDEFICHGKEKLRCGYTTGSCAAAAAKAAANMLITGELLYNISISTPKGIDLHLEVLEPFINENYAPKNIFLSGVSMGATSVMMASNLGLPHNVRGIIADCGFTSPPEIIKRVASNAFKINATPIMPALNLMCIIFGGFNLSVFL